MIDTVVQDTWNRILDRLRTEIGERTWSMWLPCVEAAGAR